MPTATTEIILYVRKKLAPGKWKWERIEEIRGRHTSSIHGKFAFRPSIGGDQRWVSLEARSFDEAKFEATRLLPGLQAKAAGLTVTEIEARNGNRITLKAAIEEFIDAKRNKRPGTLRAYRTTFDEFIEGARITYLDEIEGHPEVLNRYVRYLEDVKEHAPKTIDVRYNIVCFLLKRNNIKTRTTIDLPEVEDEAAIPFTQEELDVLFAHTPEELSKLPKGKGVFEDGKRVPAMTDKERLAFNFFLGTACREQEVSYATWDDIDWERKEYRIQKKDDVDFKPKSHEARITPMPTSLVKALRELQKNPTHDRWLFTNTENNPETHFLDKFKRIALRAGLNCGRCKSTRTVQRTVGNNIVKEQIDVTCKTHGVCENIYLHRFRKTKATQWNKARVDVRTIQHWLGHKSLETTQKYLGITDSTELREKIDTAHGD